MRASLKREINLLEVFCIASGAMISSGLFVLPAIAFTKVGPALFLSYLLASFIAVPTMLSMAELATAMPKSGGDYFYISRSLGPVMGMFAGTASWFSLSLKSVFALIGMAAYLELVFPFIPLKLFSVCLCVFFIIINIVGIKEAAKTQVMLVLFLISLLLLYIIVGFLHINIERFIPFVPYGFKSILFTSAMVFVSYGGLTKVTAVAEEIKNPSRNIPLGMILSLIIVGLIYSLVIFVTTGLVPAEALVRTYTPISDGAGIFWGNIGKIVMAFAALLSFISTANAGIISASRYPIALSRDKLLPKFFSLINRKFSTPHYSIIITGLFMILVVILLDLEILVEIASAMIILSYILANIAVIVMRESKVLSYKPKFTAPLYPYLQILGILLGGLLIYQMGMKIITLSLILIVFAFLWYLIYAAARYIHEYALIHVVERLLNKELSSGKLYEELKEIIHQRDNIVEDRFDFLIKESMVLDLDEQLYMEDFFRKLSLQLADELNIKPEKLMELFIKREKSSSTVLREGLAIPHIVIEGEGKFKIILVRAKKGII
ncbi:MAG: amino acid permease, partial [Candidatus Omnitrophota bacterium]